MTIPKINSAHGSDTRNIINRAIDSINIQGKSIQDLVAKGQLTPAQYASLIQTVNGLISKGDVSIHDFNKNLGKFDQTYLSEELLQQIAGTADINAVPADRSITPTKTTFFKPGKNLFDKSATVSGYYVHLDTGKLSPNERYTASDYIRVESNTDYAFSSSIVHLAWYNGNKNLIHTERYPNVLKSPASAVYLRVSVNNPDVEKTQVEKSSTRTGYEPYVEFIPARMTEKHEVSSEDIANNTISPDKTTFMVKAKNLFNKSTITSPGIVSPTTGVVQDSQSYNASDFIAVERGQRYYLSGTDLAPVRIAFYDANKNFIEGIASGLTNPITLPASTDFVRFSFYQGDEETVQFEKGTAATPYEPYGYKFSDEIIGLNSEEETESKIILPEKLYGIVGEELNIYIDNVVDGKHEDYYVKVDSSIGVLQNERWTFLPESSGAFNLTMTLYNKDYKVISRDSTQVIVASKSARSGVSKRALFIGSSSTASGIYTEELLNLFSEDVMNLSLIGTLGTGDNKHEGRGGWTYQMYNTSAESPFVFNGNFSFSQYISSNSLMRPDYVFFHLGINDVFSASSDAQTIARNQTAIDNMNAMISNIKTYNSNVKIGIILSYPVSDQDGFGKSYGTQYVAWRYKRNAFLAFREMLKELESRQDIFIVPAQTNVDCRNNMPTEKVPINSRNSIETIRQSNGVHIAQSGYYQFADAIYYAIKNLSD